MENPHFCNSQSLFKTFCCQIAVQEDVAKEGYQSVEVMPVVLQSEKSCENVGLSTSKDWRKMRRNLGDLFLSFNFQATWPQEISHEFLGSVILVLGLLGAEGHQ